MVLYLLNKVYMLKKLQQKLPFLVNYCSIIECCYRSVKIKHLSYNHSLSLYGIENHHLLGVFNVVSHVTITSVNCYCFNYSMIMRTQIINYLHVLCLKIFS